MSYKKYLALFFITSAALMAVALYNGFPLADNDTGAYIEQAIYPHFTPERTPFYGMFLRITSLWTSLWFTVYAQSLLLAYLILKYINLIQQPEQGSDFSFTLLTVITIISFTCVSWVTSFLMPDVFAAILLLSSILLIKSPEHKIRDLVIYSLIVFIAAIVHNSHFAAIVLFSSVLLIAALVKKREKLVKRSLALLSISITAWALLCSMNALKKHGFTFSRGRNIVLAAKFAETGVLNTYLNENCSKHPSIMCNYKDHIPADVNEFLTSGDSPFSRSGGWDSSGEMYHTIVHDVLTTPRYLVMFARKSAANTLKELVQVQAPDTPPRQGKDSETWGKVKSYFADELPAYTTSVQNVGQLSPGPCNFVYYLFFILSSLWVLLFYSKVMTKELVFIYGCILLFFVANAVTIAVFAAVCCRFQYRVWWILPATNAIIIIKYYLEKHRKARLTGTL